MINVYDANGNMLTVESVDAREYVATGNYFYRKPEEVKESAKPESPIETGETDEAERVPTKKKGK